MSAEPDPIQEWLDTDARAAEFRRRLGLTDGKHAALRRAVVDPEAALSHWRALYGEVPAFLAHPLYRDHLLLWYRWAKQAELARQWINSHEPGDGQAQAS